MILISQVVLPAGHSRTCSGRRDHADHAHQRTVRDHESGTDRGNAAGRHCSLRWEAQLRMASARAGGLRCQTGQLAWTQMQPMGRDLKAALFRVLAPSCVLLSADTLRSCCAYRAANICQTTPLPALLLAVPELTRLPHGGITRDTLAKSC